MTGILLQVAIAIAGEPVALSFTLVGEPPQMRISGKLVPSDARVVETLGWNGPIDEYQIDLPSEVWVQVDVETRFTTAPDLWLGTATQPVSGVQAQHFWSGAGGTTPVRVGAPAERFRGPYTLVITPLAHEPVRQPTEAVITGSFWIDGRNQQRDGQFCAYRLVDPVPEGVSTWELRSTSRATLHLGLWGIEGFEASHSSPTSDLGDWTRLEATLNPSLPWVAGLCSDRKGKITIRAPEGAERARDAKGGAEVATAASLAEKKRALWTYDGWETHAGAPSGVGPESQAYVNLRPGQAWKVFAVSETRAPPVLRLHVDACSRACRVWAAEQNIAVEDDPNGGFFLNLYSAATLKVEGGLQTASWAGVWPKKATEGRFEAATSAGRAPPLLVGSRGRP